MRKQSKQEEENVGVIDLDKIASAPVIDVIVRLDTRTGATDVIVFGIPSITSYDVRKILEMGRDKLEREELERLSKEAGNAKEGPVHMASE